MGECRQKTEAGQGQSKDGQAARACRRSPFEGGGGDGEYECNVNADWNEATMASVMVLRRTPEAGLVLATFLVDFLCIGLKVAWQEVGLNREEILDKLKFSPVPLARTPIAGVRLMVAGAVR